MVTATPTSPAGTTHAGPPAGVSPPARAPAGGGGDTPAPRAATVRAATSSAWPASYGLLAGFAGAAAVTVIAALAGGARHPAVALAALAVMAALVAACTRLFAAPGVAALAWLFDDGFLIHQHGHLAWPGAAGLWRLVVLLAVTAAAAGFGAWIRSHPAGPVAGAAPPVRSGSPVPHAGAGAAPPAGGTCAAPGCHAGAATHGTGQTGNDGHVAR